MPRPESTPAGKPGQVEQSALYRPDIDGLRAFAVLSVVAFHAGIHSLQGGFVGVDVFFVISGYLISGIIFRSLERNSFSVVEFYVRRINRILPALTTVLFATCAIGWGVLFSKEFESLGHHVEASSVFLSNRLLWQENGYFVSFSKPLLHLWSLAVEEQFYIFWPGLAFVVWRYGRCIKCWVGALILASFALCVWQTANSQSIVAFFSPLARLWELASGAMLFLLEQDGASPMTRFNPSSRWRSAFAAFGLMCLVVPLFVVGEKTAWPGWWTLLPVGGTLLIISAGKETPINRLVLGNPGIVGIGLISYPFYLWHWPLLVFGELVYRGTMGWTRVGIVFASLILAALTFRFIELPVRLGTRKRRSAIVLVFLLAISGVIGFTIKSGLVRPRLYRDSAPLDAQTDWAYPPGTTGLRNDSLQINEIRGDETRTILFIGDSHMEQYFPRFVYLSEAANGPTPRSLFVTYGGCPPMLGLSRFKASWHADFQCDEFAEKAFALARTPAIKAVVLTGFWETYWDGRMYITGDPRRVPILNRSAGLNRAFALFEQQVSALIAEHKSVYIILSSAEGAAFDPKSMLPPRLPGFPGWDSVRTFPVAPYLSRTAAMRNRLIQIAARTGAIVIDPIASMCPALMCPTQSNAGRPIYRDTDHIRATYARDSATFLDVIFK